MNRISDFLAKQPPRVLLGAALLLIAAIGTVDAVTGPELALSAFYLIPVFLAASYVSLRAALVISVLCVAAYLMADQILATPYSRYSIRYWNSALRLLFFFAFAYVMALRRAAEEQLQRSEERFRLLVEGAKDYAILLLDFDGRIASWNPGAERTYGYSAEEILGQSFSCFYADESQAATDLELAREQGPVSMEGWRKRKDSSRFWADIVLTPLSHAQDQKRRFAFLTRDMTERRRAEEAVRIFAELHRIDRAILSANGSGAIATEALLEIRNLIPYDTASVCLFDFELDQAEILAVSTGKEGRGHPEGQFLLEPADHEKIDLLRNGEIHYVRNVPVSGPLALGPTLSLQGLHSCIHVPLLSRNNLIGSLNLGSASADAFPEELQKIAREVADQLALAIHNAHLYEQVRGAHQRLQLLSQRLLNVQETERQHIARELHDEMGQTLTALRIHLEELEDALDGSESFPRLQESIDIVERILQQVRNLSLNLRPLVLDDLGLAAALRWYASQQSQLGGFSVNFQEDMHGTPLPSDIENASFRVAQEALTNTVRHAGAHHVQIALMVKDDTLHLVIQDDGAGFDVDRAMVQAAQGISLGILGMRERVALLNGRIEIESVPSVGTEIRVEFPLRTGVLA